MPTYKSRTQEQRAGKPQNKKQRKKAAEKRITPKPIPQAKAPVGVKGNLAPTVKKAPKPRKANKKDLVGVILGQRVVGKNGTTLPNPQLADNARLRDRRQDRDDQKAAQKKRLDAVLKTSVDKQAGSLGSLDKTAAGVAKGYYKNPVGALKGDAKTLKETGKALVSGAFITAIASPRKTTKLIKEDYKRRYNQGRSDTASRNSEAITKKEGGLSYLLDAIPVGAGVGKVIGSAAKMAPETRLGKVVTEPRKQVRTSQGVKRKQRDETDKASPNIFRAAAQKGIDARRTKSFEKRDAKAVRQGKNKRPTLRPREGEVVYSSALRRKTAQTKDTARTKSHHLLSMKREMTPALRTVNNVISERPKKGLKKPERRALSMVYEGIVPNDPKAAIGFLQRRREDIIENRKDSPRGEPTRFQKDADELKDIDYLIKNAEKAFTPRVSVAAEKLRKTDTAAAQGSDSLPTGRKLATRYGPQGHVLGVEEKPRSVRNFDEAASRKAAARRGIDFDKALGGRQAVTERPETVVERVRRVKAQASQQGLERPGYLPHVSKAGDVEPANYAVGGAKAINYKARTLDNFKEGRVDRRPEAIREGVAKTIKVKHNHRLIRDTFERHGNPRYSGKTLAGAVAKMDADGADPSQVRIWFPGKFKASIRSDDQAAHGLDTEEMIMSLGDDVRAASFVPQKGKAGIAQLKALASGELKDQRAVVLDKAVYDEVMASTHPSGATGRVVDIINAKSARAILGTGNLPWMAVDAISGAAATAIGGMIPLGPTWWKSQGFFLKMDKTSRRYIDNELGLHPRMDFLHQPKLGAAVENMPKPVQDLIEGWNAWRQTPIGKLRPIGRPIDEFLSAEGKIAVEPFRKALAYKGAKKTARDQLTENLSGLNKAFTSMVDVLKMGDSKRIAALLENPKYAEDIGRYVDNLLGDWTTKTTVERRLIGRAGLFYPYLRYSLKMLFVVMPLEHPVISTVLAKLSEIGAEEVKEIMGGEEVPWGFGKIYYEDKDGVQREFTLAKKANFLNNSLVGIEGSENLWGLLSPVIGIAASQVSKENVFTSQEWTTDGNPSWDDANTDVWHRAQILTGQILGTSYATRVAGATMSSGAKTSTDSLPIFGSEKPLEYAKAPKIASQAKRVADKKKFSTIQQLGQAAGILPRISHDKEIALETAAEKVTGTGTPSGVVPTGGKGVAPTTSKGVAPTSSKGVAPTATSAAPSKTKIAAAPEKKQKKKPKKSSAKALLAKVAPHSPHKSASAAVTTTPVVNVTSGSSSGSGSPTARTAVKAVASGGSTKGFDPDLVTAIDRHASKIDAFAQKEYGIDGATLLKKLYKGESGGRKSAVSSAGARGWGQFMPGTRQEAMKRGVDPWKSADEAVQGTILHLQGKLNGKKGLAGYNPGMASYTDYILGQKVGDIKAGKKTQSRPTGGSAPARLVGTANKAAVAAYLANPKKQGAILELAAALKEPAPSSAPTGKARVSGGASGSGGSGGSNPWDAALSVGGKVSSARRPGAITAAGNVSDHAGVPGSGTMARDFTGDLPKIAKTIAKSLGIKGYKPGSIINVTKGGYRYQLIYGTGDHKGHVHLGRKRA